MRDLLQHEQSLTRRSLGMISSVGDSVAGTVETLGMWKDTRRAPRHGLTGVRSVVLDLVVPVSTLAGIPSAVDMPPDVAHDRDRGRVSIQACGVSAQVPASP